MAISLNLPGTAERVERHTAPAINERIYREMRLRVAECYALRDEEIDARIRQLEQEWDIERILEANAATVILTGLALGTFANRKWYLLSAAAAGFLLQHALQGWCPPLPLFRRRGVRTSKEIYEEITALRALRGDFGAPEDIEAALERAMLH
jgi:hypothetical protein